MTIEEKARAYDEALERARALNSGKDIDVEAGTTTCEYIFPELKESESERIRKDLIEWIKEFPDMIWRGHYKKDVLAWLEKQGEQTHAELCQPEVTSDQELEPKFKVGDTMRTLQEAANGYTDGMPVVVSIDNEYYHCTNELIAIKDQDGYEFPPINVKQKPVDNVEPKFKVGDWVVYDHRPYQVVELPKECYINLGLRRNGKVEFAPSSYCRHWAIQDAKDGDVLASELTGSIFLFRGIKDNKIDFYCDYYTRAKWTTDSFDINDSSEYYGSVEESQDIHPATKEQRDLLFAKMKEAGYEWDSEKKELKKIEPKMLDADKVIEWLCSNSTLFGAKWCKTENIIEQFKKDFGL